MSQSYHIRFPKPTSWWKKLLTHLMAMYLGAGIFGGFVMYHSIPAMNVIGVAAYAVTWPNFLYCARQDNDCIAMDFIPLKYKAYMFNFEED